MRIFHRIFYSSTTSRRWPRLRTNPPQRWISGVGCGRRSRGARKGDGHSLRCDRERSEHAGRRRPRAPSCGPHSGLDMPFVFLTGSPNLDSAIEAIELRAFRYLLKPVRSVELLDVMNKAVRWHQLARVRKEAAKISRRRRARNVRISRARSPLRPTGCGWRCSPSFAGIAAPCLRTKRCSARRSRGCAIPRSSSTPRKSWA